MASRICDVKEIEELMELGTFTWSWTEKKVKSWMSKAESQAVWVETIQGRSSSLSGDDSDSEESELDASEGTEVYRGWDHTDGECGASWCKCWRSCSGCCRHWPCCLLRRLLATLRSCWHYVLVWMWQMRRSIIAERLHLLQRCSRIGSDWLRSLAALLALHSSRKAAATSTHCTLYCAAIWTRSISRPDRSHLSLKTGTC